MSMESESRMTLYQLELKNYGQIKDMAKMT